MNYCIKRLFKALLIGRIVSSRNIEVFQKKALKRPFLWTGEYCSGTAVYSWLRQPTVVSVSVFCRIRQNMAVIRHGRIRPKHGAYQTCVPQPVYGRNDGVYELLRQRKQSS